MTDRAGNQGVPWGNIPATIENVLREIGPMTVAEMLFSGVPGTPNDVRKAAVRMSTISNRRQPIGQRRIHITGWTTDAEGQRTYPRPIYAIGHGENKPKPRRKARRVIVSEWYKTNKIRKTHNFVFNLGGQL